MMVDHDGFGRSLADGTTDGNFSSCSRQSGVVNKQENDAPSNVITSRTDSFSFSVLVYF